MNAPDSQKFDFEVHVGFSFWDKYGDGSNPLGASKNKDPLALVNRFGIFAPEFLKFGTTFAGLVDGEVVVLAGSTNVLSRSVGLQYVSVRNDRRDNGYSSKLCKAMFAYLASIGVNKIECSGYSKVGHQRLRHVLHREALSQSCRLIGKDHIEY